MVCLYLSYLSISIYPHTSIHPPTGRVDPFGRFVVGGYHSDAKKLVSAMYMLHSNDKGKLCVDTIFPNIGCMNSICFSHEKDLSNTKLYFTDSRWNPPKICVVEDYGKIGKVHDKTPFAQWKFDGSAPDGSVVDVEGHVWTAHFGTGKVVRRNRNSGKIDFEILVPVPHVTCLAFGGQDMRTVYITNASLKKLPFNDPRVAQGLAGGLFSARLPSHIAGGRAEYRFGCSSRRNFTTTTAFSSSHSSSSSRLKIFFSMAGLFGLFGVALWRQRRVMSSQK
jgi:L-arabinonolactonase